MDDTSSNHLAWCHHISESFGIISYFSMKNTHSLGHLSFHKKINVTNPDLENFCLSRLSNFNATVLNSIVSSNEFEGRTGDTRPSGRVYIRGGCTK